MQITIDETNPAPVYQQIIDQIHTGILSGEMKTKTFLPSIRQLANDLEVNHNTVAKAYQFLEKARIIQTAGRRGTIIREDAIENIQNDHHDTYNKRLSEIFEQMYDSGISSHQIRKMVNAILKEK